MRRADSGDPKVVPITITSARGELREESLGRRRVVENGKLVDEGMELFKPLQACGEARFVSLLTRPMCLFEPPAKALFKHDTRQAR